MSRAILILFLTFLFAVALVVFLIKKVSGNPEKTLQEETAEVIQKAAEGMSWMQEQWQVANRNTERSKPETASNKSWTGNNERIKMGTVTKCSYCEEEYEISPLSPDSVRRGVCPQCNNALL